jgi:ribosomal protein L37E
MSSSPKMICTKCGKDVTVSGVQICPKCDPGAAEQIRNGVRVKLKTPELCDTCYEEHEKTPHLLIGPRVVTRSEFLRCPNCHEPGYNPSHSACDQCGHSPAIG